MFDRPWAPAAFIVVLTAALVACGGDDAQSTEAASPGPLVTSAPVTPSSSTTVPVVDPDVSADSFRNINDMTPVRGFFVDNLLGDLDATLAVAGSVEGGVYPVGSLVQLVPGEAMVKRAPGFDAASNDWEFFELVPSPEGTEIRVRGGAEVVNAFGGSCAGCHSLAAPEWDFICEDDHGCEPLQIGREIIDAVQMADPRPRS